MQTPQRIPRVLLRVGVPALICALALPAAAQTSGRFPDLPPEEPPPPPQPAVPVGPQPGQYAPVYDQPANPGAWAANPAAAAQPYYQPAAEYEQPVQPGGFWPAVLPYRDGDPIPAGYQLEQSRLTGLMTGGFVVFGLGWVTGFGIAASHGFDRPNGFMAVPILGPWVSLFRRESPCDIEDVEVKDDAQECVNNALDEASLIAVIAIDGLVQAVGTGLFIGGALSKRKQLVREDVASFRVVPQRVGRRGWGLGLRASF